MVYFIFVYGILQIIGFSWIIWFIWVVRLSLYSDMIVQ